MTATRSLALAFLLPLLAFTIAPVGAAGEALPDARALLSLVRAHEAQQHLDLTGQLKNSSIERSLKVPFRLVMRPGEVVYSFANPAESLTLKLNGADSHLLRTDASGKTTPIAGSKLDGTVRATDITFEDLAMKFLYWDDAQTLREETVMTRKCWVVEVTPPPNSGSQYDKAALWIEKTGALMRAECFSNGQLVKRFEVRKVQRTERGGYILKSMRISSLDPQGQDSTPTYLEIDSLPLAPRPTRN